MLNWSNIIKFRAPLFSFLYFFSFTAQLVSFLVWMYKFFQVLYSPLNAHYYWVIIPIVVQVSKLWFPILVIISSIVITNKHLASYVA